MYDYYQQMCTNEHGVGKIMHAWQELKIYIVLKFFFIIQDVVGSSLLSVLDQFALDISPDTGNISSGNISEENIIEALCQTLTYDVWIKMYLYSMYWNAVQEWNRMAERSCALIQEYN